MAVERALISVFDKTGIVEFAKRRREEGLEIVDDREILRAARVEVRYRPWSMLRRRPGGDWRSMRSTLGGLGAGGGTGEDGGALVAR